MVTEQSREVERRLRIEARPEIVFSYFTDPEKAIRWKGIAAELDPQPGGIYRLDLGNGMVVLGRYVLLEPPHRLIFTWGWENGDPVPPGSSTVEVTLTPDGGGTLLHLRHSGLPFARLGEFGQGWDHFLPRLSIAAAGGDPDQTGSVGPAGTAPATRPA